MKVAVMKDYKSWIVDSYVDLIIKAAPKDWRFTDFPPDVSLGELLELAKNNDLVYSSYWQPFLRNNLVQHKDFPGHKVLIQTWHLMEKGHKSYDPTTEKLALPSIKHIAYPCRNTQARLALNGVKANMHKIDMCCDVDFFKGVSPPQLFDTLVIGCFSKAYPRKRMDIIASALDRMDNVKFLTTHGIDHPKGEVIGNVKSAKQMRELFSRLHVYISTSDEEGGPVGVLQAMACGIPVVSTPTGFAFDLVRHGKNGFGLPFDNPLELIRRLQWIRANYQVCRKIGESGRDAVAPYTEEAFAEQMIQLFRRVAGEV